MLSLFINFVSQQVQSKGAEATFGSSNKAQGFCSRYDKQLGSEVATKADPKIEAKKAPFFHLLRMHGASNGQICSLIEQFAKERKLRISTDPTRLEDLLLPTEINQKEIRRCSTEGITLQNQTGKEVFVTPSIENALEKGIGREVLFIQPWLYTRFFESLVRESLLTEVCRPAKSGILKKLSWALFISLSIGAFFAPFQMGAIIYTALFVIKAVGSFGFYIFQQIVQTVERQMGLPPVESREYGTKESEILLLPCLTILIPLYKEKDILKQLSDGLKTINYPKELLDIKIITEADDLITNAALREISLPEYFHIVAIPAAKPRTKSKAINYAGSLALGSYICVYDAENIPHPNQPNAAIVQLQKYLSQEEGRPAKNRHNKTEETVFAVQCPLSWYNWNENLITMMMSIEYDILFRRLIPLMSTTNGFIPLGGTSNFFSKKVLHEVNMWQSSSVTEDFELAIRGYNSGKKIHYCPVGTEEECVTSWKWWVRQRSRWIKGFIISLGDHFIPTHYKLINKPMALLGVYVSGWMVVIHPVMHPLLLLKAIRLPSPHGWEMCVVATLFVCNLMLVWPSAGKSSLSSKIITTISFVLYNCLIFVPFLHAIAGAIFDKEKWNKTPHTRPKVN